MRRRQFFNRVIPGLTTAAALAFTAGAVHGESTRASAVLEITDSAGTGVIAGAVSGLTLRVAAPVTASPTRLIAPSGIETTQLGTGTLGADYVASINNIDDISASDLAAGVQRDPLAQSRETGNNLILAQYN